MSKMIIPDPIFEGLDQLRVNFEKDGKVLIISIYVRDPKDISNDGLLPLMGNYEHIRFSTKYNATDVVVLENYYKVNLQELREGFLTPSTDND